MLQFIAFTNFKRSRNAVARGKTKNESLFYLNPWQADNDAIHLDLPMWVPGSGAVLVQRDIDAGEYDGKLGSLKSSLESLVYLQ